MRLHNQINKSLAESLVTAIKAAFNFEIELEAIYPLIAPPPSTEKAHLCFPCFILAKNLKVAPPVAAQKIKEAFGSNSLVETLEAKGPYLNFFLNPKTLGSQLLTEIQSGVFFKKPLFKNPPKTMIEYSQPNTHKVLHVGHMRNLCLGNTLVNLHRYSGFDLISSTYPGDVGTHVAKCLWFINKNKLVAPETHKGAWLGEIYAKSHELLESEKGTELEEKNRTELTAILKQLENKSGSYFDMWKETREWSIALMKESYKWADVEFDRWFFESEVDSPSLEFAKKLFKEGKLVVSEGATGMDLTEDKLGFCLLIKTDGTGLYATKDVELARKKFEEFKIEKNIYVVDNRQAFHFKQVFKVLEKIGFPQAKNCYHLEYDMVELPDGAMSSRKGNIVPLMALIENMEKTIKENFLNRYTDWSVDEINSTATILANGAIKYGMVRMDNNRKIIFDMKEWLKLDGETGPYLQYVCARINSLLAKLQFDSKAPFVAEKLTTDVEKELLVSISRFNDVVATATTTYKTSLLCAYLFELSKLYNTFYAECPIGKLEDQEHKNARMHLSHMVQTTLKQGLALLGIKAPERM